MRVLLLFTFTFILSLPVFGQAKDSAYYKRVDDRVSYTLDHFSSNVNDADTFLDTVAYIKRVYAFHLEKIHAITNNAKNRENMYAYAVQLHNKRLADLLPEDILKIYQDSFSSNAAGFTFCPICTFRYVGGQEHCGHCGEQLTGP